MKLGDQEYSIETVTESPGQVAQLVGASPWYTKVEGSIPGQGTYKNEPMNAWVSGTAIPCFSLFLVLSFPLSKINKLKKKVTEKALLLIVDGERRKRSRT